MGKESALGAIAGGERVVLIKSLISEDALGAQGCQVQLKSSADTSESCGLAVEHSSHDQKVVGSILVQSKARWKWCQSHARIDSYTRFWFNIEKIRKYKYNKKLLI